MKFSFRCITMIGLLTFIKCDSELKPIILEERLSAKFSCVNPTSGSICSKWGKFIIPNNLDLIDRTITAVHLDSLKFQINYDAEPGYFLLKSTVIYFRSGLEDSLSSFAFGIDPIQIEESIAIHKPLALNLSADQFHLLERVLTEEKSIQILFGTVFFGQAEYITFNLFTTVKIMYE